ncbi:MAG: aminotransferase class I/II-fold pyridoxal phosphate-dependent enzyme [Muricauda sp.]|jgi:aspartate/methionine/tyrosine aminotransferase|nr:aminotransferase class I/II-fold pyridoxal phosphate-dependent enzyme [Allomuricauda sp.]MBO6533810.1 aminotransferase class I/II-fold pyridoxal phosphate-dependent enzyme [Allomuricauda sp.]MBO6589529.1 aminotransferase class I/II-fold pyridoxal phosphate-dependent enzyme [Allomuricauda sp.]MBO6619039.1 aminotransferase class I/II-fold pyridoxal phosphate-dependent enzyme [Allomuricauda sp.]MBO6645065.1 aminotransferase class I/II-fold pyridoxal phosphate-dependent enzyme [Allomuricauda sp.
MVTADRLNSVKEYYFSTKLREVRGLMAQGKPIINMGIGSPDLAPSPQVLETLRNSIIDAGAHQYQSYQGLPQLRKAIADFYQQKFDVAVEPDSEILPLMGSKEGIMHISMAFLNEGDEVLLPNPGYPTYASVTNLVGGVPVTYDLNEEKGWFPDLDELAKKDLSKVKLMWISYPHMPTGATATMEQLESLVDFAKRNNILLVNDNPYSFVLSNNPTSILSIEGAKEHTLELNSLSKTFNMAGWRVGMVLGSAAHITAILKVKSNMDSGMFYGIQMGAIAALQSGPEWFEALDRVYSTRRELMFELADTLGCTYDKNAVGMFVWCKLPEGAGPSEEFIDQVLYDKDIFIAPGTIFGSNGEGYIRFSLCVKEEKIKEAIARF